MLYRFPLV